MDTVTHIAFGIGLAGLSQIDPSVSSDALTSVAVLFGTLAGSQAPDTDTLLKLHSNAKYVRNHRGWSHSIPAWFIWTGLISVSIWLIFPNISLLVITRWVFIAVLVHVFTDLFNSYGTQALRPFHDRWIAWDVINIFDPFVFIAHFVAILLWMTALSHGGIIFSILYVVILLYFLVRTLQHVFLERKLPLIDSEAKKGDVYTAIPTIQFSRWNLIKQHACGAYTTGEWKNGQLLWVGRSACETTPEIESSRMHPDVAAFLYFSRMPCAKIEYGHLAVTVYWLDMRYQHRKQYPFLAVVRYNANMEPRFSYVGWTSIENLRKRLKQVNTDE
jgi:inner membrane protein